MVGKLSEAAFGATIPGGSNEVRRFRKENDPMKRWGGSRPDREGAPVGGQVRDSPRISKADESTRLDINPPWMEKEGESIPTEVGRQPGNLSGGARGRDKQTRIRPTNQQAGRHNLRHHPH